MPHSKYDWSKVDWQMPSSQIAAMLGWAVQRAYTVKWLRSLPHDLPHIRRICTDWSKVDWGKPQR